MTDKLMQEDKLRPGEFVGQDGKLYRVDAELWLSSKVGPSTRDNFAIPLGHSDFPSALAALNALADEAQWVEFDHLSDRMRINREGTQLQYLSFTGWCKSVDQKMVVDAIAALRANGITVGGGE